MLLSLLQSEAKFVLTLNLNVQIVRKATKLLDLEVWLDVKLRLKLEKKMLENLKPKINRQPLRQRSRKNQLQTLTE